ncbi:MAG: SdiA-regulated domain-containing protein [Myxococcota bacterium]
MNAGCGSPTDAPQPAATEDGSGSTEGDAPSSGVGPGDGGDDGTTSGVTGPSEGSTAATGIADDESSGTDEGGTTTGTGGRTIEPVDLTRYEADGPIQMIPAPGGNASGITWNDDTDRLWIVQNGAGAFFEYAGDDLSAPIRRIQLGGINGNDTEGLAYMGGGELAVAFESGYGVYIADVPDGDVDVTIPVKQVLTLAAPPMVGNNGLEGIAYDRDSQVFYAVGEGQDPAAPRRFFRFARPVDEEVDLTWEDPGLDVAEPFDADAVLPGDGTSLDLAGIAFDRRDGNVLIVSHTGSAVLQVDPAGDGTVLGQLALPPNQWEGVTLRGADADLWVVGESNDVQRYLYEEVAE